MGGTSPNLPEDDEQCFVAFKATCRRNMTRMIDEDRSGDFCLSVQDNTWLWFIPWRKNVE